MGPGFSEQLRMPQDLLHLNQHTISVKKKIIDLQTVFFFFFATNAMNAHSQRWAQIYENVFKIKIKKILGMADMTKILHHNTSEFHSNKNIMI